MSVSEILNAAADDIEVNGWGIGVEAMYENSNHCALGAIGAAYERLDHENMTNERVVPQVDELGRVGRLRRRYYEPKVAHTPAARALARYLDNPWIPAWNDNVAMNGSIVIEALRAAAVIEAAREEVAAGVEVREPVAA